MPIEEEQNKEEFKNQVEQIKLDIVQEAARNVKKQVREQETIQMSTKIEKIKETSVNAIEKEMKLEQMLEKEEIEKEAQETAEMQNQIDHEEKKNDFLLKAIKEKQMEDQYNISKAKSESAIETIAIQTKKQIAIKRLEIKRKIMEMRKKQGKLFYFL
jgi:hypothetical protein